MLTKLYFSANNKENGWWEQEQSSHWNKNIYKVDIHHFGYLLP
jgi:hypothetical protein